MMGILGFKPRAAIALRAPARKDLEVLPKVWPNIDSESRSLRGSAGKGNDVGAGVFSTPSGRQDRAATGWGWSRSRATAGQRDIGAAFVAADRHVDVGQRHPLAPLQRHALLQRAALPGGVAGTMLGQWRRIEVPRQATSMSSWYFCTNASCRCWTAMGMLPSSSSYSARRAAGCPTWTAPWHRQCVKRRRCPGLGRADGQVVDDAQGACRRR